MPEWLYEEGIGENRAVLVEDGEIVQSCIERHNRLPRAGAVMDARFYSELVASRSALIKLNDGSEAYLDPVPRGIGPGSRFRVEITREWIHREPAEWKSVKAKVVPHDTPLRDGPLLLDRIKASGHPVRFPQPFEPDAFEAAGWSELAEQAITGEVLFPNGRLWIQRTYGMTVIDVDGSSPPDQLAIDGARAAARAINRLGISGSIGIDLPTVRGRAARKRADDAVDSELRGSFERTAMNGFGFVQIIIPQRRESVFDLFYRNRRGFTAFNLYRQAERLPGSGPIAIIANSQVAEAVDRTTAGPHQNLDHRFEQRVHAPVQWVIRNHVSEERSYVTRVNDDEDVDWDGDDEDDDDGKPA